MVPGRTPGRPLRLAPDASGVPGSLDGPRWRDRCRPMPRPRPVVRVVWDFFPSAWSVDGGHPPRSFEGLPQGVVVATLIFRATHQASSAKAANPAMSQAASAQVSCLMAFTWATPPAKMA